MFTIAKYNQVRVSAQKMRLIANEIRGKKVLIALQILFGIQKKSAYILKKLLNSAIANADHNYDVKINKLKIFSIFVNNGPTMKRMFPRAKGRSDRILKRTSHITIILSCNIKNLESNNGSKSTS